MATKKKKSAAPPPQLQKITLNMLDSDLDKLRTLAGQNGVGYQVYLRLLVHDTLAKIEVPA